MTFEKLEILRSEMTDEDIVRADELTALLEIAAEKHPHKRLPRSFRFIGARQSLSKATSATARSSKYATTPAYLEKSAILYARVR